ncbi:MAG: hypothetical protein JRG89_02180 [Deltaproteobacteria bacterium]|nr:hypothetical protein [Deltaproteobacteria bacterium]MBW2387220.1 hypothetical protein [Deltaproteobacteria bacterium]MBW2723409.1 hypothetical protein [Deltaproteobacteria bacterium]
MDATIGPLLAADESFCHQIVDTFASVAQTDRSWTEKVAAMAGARDGGLQLDFGIGKYTNRNVIDAFAGVSRGCEQWTVRASRGLHTDPNSTSVGPIHYEVLEPYKAVRFRLEPNDTQPISFEWTFESKLPAVLEEREHRRSRDRYRVDEDLIRYHQIGVASGWVEVHGERSEIDNESWLSTRDHSWGVRLQVGRPPKDLAPRPEPEGLAVMVSWSPMLLTDAEGEPYGIHHYYHSISMPGYQSVSMQGGIEYPDGRRSEFVSLEPELRFSEKNRRLLGGDLHFGMRDGSRRTVRVTAMGDTGFHLGTGLYFGLDDHWHGEWRGNLHVDGEYVADCGDPETARRIHQLRDCLVAVEDPEGGGRGWGNIQTIVTGPFPDLGLTADSSFL